MVQQISTLMRVGQDEISFKNVYRLFEHLMKTPQNGTILFIMVNGHKCKFSTAYFKPNPKGFGLTYEVENLQVKEHVS